MTYMVCIYTYKNNIQEFQEISIYVKETIDLGGHYWYGKKKESIVFCCC